MSFEVVYTSAPRGLYEGTSGFCTVACTAGIPRTLLKKLESLSGYTHAHPAGSGKNPVNYSHCIVSVQQQIYHVLSRIADAGPDHTGRSNKIAHHLAIPAAETRRIRGGPLALLSDNRFWFQEWNRKPAKLPADRMPAAAGGGGGDFGTWEDVFGDAGWAGVLGEAVSDKPKPVCVIVPSADDALDLLEEAMQLVAPAKRWKVGFSTYFTQAAGNTCHWRFMLDGTPAVQQVRSRSAVMVVDHKARKPLPRGNPFVEAAQAGDPSRVLKAAAPKREAPSRARKKLRRRPLVSRRLLFQKREHRCPGLVLIEVSGPVSFGANRLAPDRARARQRHSDDDWDGEDVHEINLDKLEEGTNRNTKPILIAGAVVALLAVVGFLAYQYWWKPNSSTPSTSNTNAVKAAE